MEPARRRRSKLHRWATPKKATALTRIAGCCCAIMPRPQRQDPRDKVDERAVSWQLFYGGRTDKDCLEIHEQMIGVVKLKQPDPLDENAKAQGFCHAFAR